MSFEPLLSAAQPIPVHAILALFAIVAGGVQFLMPKGTVPHKALGYAWILAMVIVAVSSFWIGEYRWVGPFGPIHILSVLTLWGVAEGLWYARKRDIARHRRNLIQVYAFALILAGAFTLAPGRIMHQVVFG